MSLRHSICDELFDSVNSTISDKKLEAAKVKALILLADAMYTLAWDLPKVFINEREGTK